MLGYTRALWFIWAQMFVHVRVYPVIMVHQGSEICPCQGIPGHYGSSGPRVLSMLGYTRALWFIRDW